MERRRGAVTEIAPSVLQVENVFTEENLLYLNNYLDNAQPSHTTSTETYEPFVTLLEGSRASEFTLTKRETFELPDIKINHPNIVKDLSTLLFNYLDGELLSVRLWKDYPYYENPIHYDCNDDEHVMIVYLTDHPLCGTQYWDKTQGDNTGGTAPDSQHGLFIYFKPVINWALCIKSPEKLLHGMKYWVPKDHIRKTVSVIWKSK